MLAFRVAVHRRAERDEAAARTLRSRVFSTVAAPAGRGSGQPAAMAVPEGLAEVQLLLPRGASEDLEDFVVPASAGRDRRARASRAALAAALVAGCAALLCVGAWRQGGLRATRPEVGGGDLSGGSVLGGWQAALPRPLRADIQWHQWTCIAVP